MTDLKDILRTLPNRGLDDDENGPVSNPGERSYIGWGPHEDYMIVKGEGWNSVMTVESSAAFLENMGEADPDLNLVADFYFEIRHESVECVCDGSGLNPATKAIEDDFYDFANTGRRWSYAITQDEVEALQKSNRLRKWDGEKWAEVPGLTAAEVNAANARGAAGFGDYNHDAINRWILVRTRAERLGVYGKCPECGGDGYKRTSPDYLVLNIWLLHPRKGASRGVEVKHVDPADLPKLKEWLANYGLKSHMQHFAWCQPTEAA